MAIILQSYSQYHLLVLYYYYRLSSFLLYIILYCYLQIIYITTKIDTNFFKLCSKSRRVTTQILHIQGYHIACKCDINNYLQINDNNNDISNVCMNIYIHESPLPLEELRSHVYTNEYSRK